MSNTNAFKNIFAINFLIVMLTEEKRTIEKLRIMLYLGPTEDYSLGESL